jgi:membrane protein implicated in regulation of membrane protease activity
MGFVTLWWVWMAGALALGILEVLLPGFVFLGFACGAVGVSLILLISGVTPTMAVLAFIFAGLSLVAWLILRRYFALPGGQVKTFDSDIND